MLSWKSTDAGPTPTSDGPRWVPSPRTPWQLAQFCRYSMAAGPVTAGLGLADAEDSAALTAGPGLADTDGCGAGLGVGAAGANGTPTR